MRVFVTAIIASIIISLGIVGGGYYVAKTKMTDRYVTVKGVAEKNVEADLAIWPIKFTITGNDLAKMQDVIDKNFSLIKTFIKNNGIDEEPWLSKPDITDLLAQAYRSERVVGDRFIISQPVMLRTNNVDAVVKMVGSLGDLIKQGVVLNDYSGPRYIYTKLNDIKPEMIAEATKSARKGAEQFAADSKSPIIGIRRANQGVFTILARNDSNAYSEQNEKDKTVRVVSTIEYILGAN